MPNENLPPKGEQQEALAESPTPEEGDGIGRGEFLKRSAIVLAAGGAALAYSYGKNLGLLADDGEEELALSEEIIGEDDPSLLVTGQDAVEEMQRMEEQVAMMQEQGLIQPESPDQDPRSITAATGALLMAGAVVPNQEGGGQTRRSFVKGAMLAVPGVALLLGANSAEAKTGTPPPKLRVLPNLYSNKRPGKQLTPEEEKDWYGREVAGKHVDLDLFMRMRACHSPLGTRLCEQMRLVQEHNAKVQKRKDAGEATPGKIVKFPIEVVWDKKQDAQRDNIFHSIIGQPVKVKRKDGTIARAIRYFSIGQVPNLDTRARHYQTGSGYLGTDKKAAEEHMEKLRRGV